MADIIADLFPGDETIEDAPGSLDTLDFGGGGDLIGSAGGETMMPKPLQSLNAPISGQSLTQSKEHPLPYEMPPQFTNEDEAAHAIFMALTEKQELSKVLQLLDAGVPVSVIAESVVMFGASEGKWNMDMSLLLLEPVMVMLAGVASKAGINFSMAPPEKDLEVLNTEPMRKIFKDKLGKKKDALGDSDAKKATEHVASMIQRPSDKTPIGGAAVGTDMPMPTPEEIA